MIDWLKKYGPYIIIIGIGFWRISEGDYGIGAGISIGGSVGYYYGIDKKILKH